MSETRRMPAAGRGPRRPHPLVELTRARLVEFVREPEAVFWVFVFPVLLALALGIAFRSKPTERLRAAVEHGAPAQARILAILRASPDLTVVELSAAEAAQALRTGKARKADAPVRLILEDGREYKRAGKLNTLADLHEAIIHGAVKRIRPKMMTVMAAFMGLLPIMWSMGAGADMMKRIAAPMVGGLITSFAMELLVYPAVYLLWKRREIGPSA